MKQLLSALCVALCALASSSAWSAVEINKAGQAELESVKGIGPSMSTKILEARKKGDFKNWNDLVERVSGIGAGNANRLSQAGLTVAGTSYTAQTSATTKSFKGVNPKATQANNDVRAGDKSGKTDKSAKSAKSADSTHSNKAGMAQS